MNTETSTAPLYQQFQLSELPYAEQYKLLTGAVIPRPIAWVTTLSATGKVNAAPFSQFVIAAVNPGLLAFSIGPRQHGVKDTLVNIERTGEFVINTVTEDMGEAVQKSAEEFPPEVSEAELLGLDLIPSTTVAVPRLAASKVQFECTVHQILKLGNAPNHFVIGEVKLMHVRGEMVKDYKIDPLLHAPLARIGGRNYTRFGEIIAV